MDRSADVWPAESVAPRLWRAEELGVFLRMQLAAPLFTDLEGYAPERAARLRTSLAGDSYYRELESFADLFHLWPPPRDLLALTKEFAWSQLGTPESLLPHEVASVIYYASLLLTHLRCQEPLSRLNGEALLKGVRWALDQPWLDVETRRLFEEGRRQLELRPPG